ncbi:MAG: creatininase family protein [Chloroflexi bacterium]|nr:MAG: creatininase family protein [Chloroflexota bacterium]
MQLQDMNWMDVQRYLETDNRIILVTGATEQHAYLSLLTDVLIPSHLANAAARREGVLIAPPLNFGLSRHFLDYPGTISLTQETFDAVLIEIVHSLMTHGFARFFICNGHGGNYMPEALKELHFSGDVSFVWYNWWRSPSVGAFEKKYGLRLLHANWGENFPFTRVVPTPVDGKEEVPHEVFMEAENVRDVLGDGSFGGPYTIDDDRMKELFDLVVDEMVMMLRQLRNS